MKRPPGLAAAALAAVFVVTSVGCTTGGLRSPEYATDDWYETEIGGIGVLTNAPHDVARRSLRKLSRFLILARAVGNHSLPREPIRLHLFAREAQYHGFVSDQTSGHAIWGPSGYFIALASDHPGYTTQVLFHEVMHLLLAERGEPLPSWYHEGYAEYLASAILRPGVATLGRPLPNRAEALKRFESMGLVALFQQRSGLIGRDPALFYAEAWAFLHFIHASVHSSKREPQLDRFLELLGEGKSAGGAFAMAFGETIGRVERLYLLHRKRLAEGDEVLYRHYVLPEEEVGQEEEIVFRPVSRVAVARELADHALLTGRSDVALRHYDEVLSIEPREPRARLGRILSLAKQEQFEAAWATLEEFESGSALATQARGRLLQLSYLAAIEAQEHPTESGAPTDDPPEPDALLQESCELLRAAVERDPTCRACWEGIALFHARHPGGDPTAGLDALGRVGPWTEQGTLRAELLLRQGEFDMAQAEVERVIATTHDASVATAGRGLLLRILRSRNESLAPRS